MRNVFSQPFSLFTIPCFFIALPIWIVSHNYRCILWGWTPWHALVVIATVYALYSVLSVNLLPVLPDLPRPLA
jgi:hypothetical protein